MAIEIPKTIKKSITAVKYCCEKDFSLAALMLIYTQIDILSWLGLPPSDNSNRAGNKGFKKWVDTFMLGHDNSKLRCTSSDLWASRCSLLHTGTTHSTDSQKGTAQQIFYASGIYATESLQSLMDTNQFPNYQNVHVLHRENELLHDFENAVDRFFNHNFDESMDVAIKRKIKQLLDSGNTKKEDVQAADLYLQNKGLL